MGSCSRWSCQHLEQHLTHSESSLGICCLIGGGTDRVLLPPPQDRDDWLRSGGLTQAGQSDFLSLETARTIAWALGWGVVDLAGGHLLLVKATGLLGRTLRQPMGSWGELSNHRWEQEPSRDFLPALSFLSFPNVQILGEVIIPPSLSQILTGGWLPIPICLMTELTSNKQQAFTKHVPCTHQVNQSGWNY